MFNSVMSDEFPIETVLRQGDTLSSILFIITLESVVREIQKDYTGLKNEEKNMVMAVYADEFNNHGRNRKSSEKRRK